MHARSSLPSLLLLQLLMLALLLAPLRPHPPMPAAALPATGFTHEGCHGHVPRAQPDAADQLADHECTGSACHCGCLLPLGVVSTTLTMAAVLPTDAPAAVGTRQPPSAPADRWLRPPIG